MFGGKWYKLYVKCSEDNTPERMKRVDDHLIQAAPANYVYEFGEEFPTQEPDGTYQVRVLEESSLGYVKFILKHYGLEIIREVENDDSIEE